MRTRALSLAAVALAASLPFTVAAAGDDSCDASDLTITADGLEVEYDAPAEPLSSGDELLVTLDLSGTDFGSGSITVTASWTQELNDYDLMVNDEGPLTTSLLEGGNTTETASAGKIGHCDTFVVAVDNFFALDMADAVTLTFDVRAR